MCDKLSLLRADLMAALEAYRASYSAFPMPDRRQYDVAHLEKVIGANHSDVSKLIEAVEAYLRKIKTLWWPFYNKSRLRDSLTTVVCQYKTPDAN